MSVRGRRSKKRRLCASDLLDHSQDKDLLLSWTVGIDDNCYGADNLANTFKPCEHVSYGYPIRRPSLCEKDDLVT